MTVTVMLNRTPVSIDRGVFNALFRAQSWRVMPTWVKLSMVSRLAPSTMEIERGQLLLLGDHAA
jgi:hypothetical protein